MKYRVQCPDNHFAFFNLTSLEIEEPICEDRNFPQPRCIDSLQVSRGGGGFGFIETCGTNIPSELASSLDSGTIEVILRTSDRGRFPGFSATVVCVSTGLLAMTGNDNSGGQGSNSRQLFSARVTRQVEYVKRMKRSTLSLEDATTLACSVDEVNVPFNGGITYVNRVVTILDMTNMAVIRRLPSPINKLVVIDTNGTQLEFIREAPLTNDSVTIFSGPGPLTRAGVFVFFTSFTTLPELGNTPPEAVIPAARVADVTGILLAAHSRLALEGNGEALTLDELEPPPIDLDGLGIEGDDTGDNVTTANPRFARHTPERSRRIRRLTENIQPVQCNYTNNDVGLAVLNQMTINPVLITIIDVIFNCTEREQPGRFQEIIESIAIDFRFTQDEYLVREDVGNVTVCLEIATEGFLPRDVVVSLVTVNGNATEPEDYSFVNTTSTFFNATAQGGPGSLMCIQIDIFNDNLIEFDEMFVVTADSPDPNVNTTFIMATVIILDEDVMFQITNSPGSFTVTETASTLAESIVVSLLVGTLPFPVEIVLNDIGTAKRSDGDFTAPLVLTFDTGSGPGVSSSAQVTILRDLLVEENETLILQLTTMPLARLAFPVGEDLVEGTIMDVDVPIFQLVAETNFTEESNTIVQLCVELVQSTLTFPIDVLVQDGTQMATLFGIFFPDNRLATIGEDYLSFGTTLTFEAGSGPGTKFFVNVSILQDVPIEIEEVIIVVASILSTRGEFSSGGDTDVTTITIIDNEAETVVCLELTEPENGTITYSINQPPPFPLGTEAKYTCNLGLGLEGGDVLRVCLGDVVNTVGQWNGAAPQCNAITCETLSAPENGTVSYSTDNNNIGAFSFGTEAYFSCDVGFSLVGNETRTCGDGNMTVGEFNGTTPACEALGSINGGAAADVVMFREDAGNVTVTFQLVGDVADRAFVADVQNINTTSGVDYSFGDPTSSVSSNNTRALVSVPIEIFEDVVAEFDEVFMLTISSGLFNTSITVIILDNDVFIVFPFGVPVLDVFENFNTNINFIDLQTFNQFPFILTIYFTNNGSAIENEDFSIHPVFLYPSTSQEGSRNTTQLIILNDDMVEMNETILLWPHSSPIGRLAFNVDDVVNVTIIDDDVPLFSVLPGATSAAESDTTIVNTIQLVEGVLTYPIAITIQTNVTVVSPDPMCLQTRGTIPESVFCPGGSIYCENGEPASESSCLAIERYCDGQVDCSNGRDESAEFCGNCSPGTIICLGDPDFTCVSNTLACDGRVDCPNGVDESPEACGCPVQTQLPLCRFNNGTTQCVLGVFLCDGIVDCDDGFDESTTLCGCPQGTANCANSTQCVSFDWFCNGAQDCENGGDEIPQLCGNCPTDEILCPNTTTVCLSNLQLCDGIEDCPGGTDEAFEFCGSGLPLGYSCADGSDCFIPFGFICNGVEDCSNGRDEENCRTNILQCFGGGSTGQVSIPQSNFCPGGTVYCEDGEPASGATCVLIDNFCDGNVDCSNGRDESEEFCSECGEGFLQCSVIDPQGENQCFSNTAACNGESDCQTGYDESVDLCGCPNIEDLRFCKFLDGSTQCISSSLVCNGEIDCENGEDESVDICGQIVNNLPICPLGSAPCIEEASECLVFERFCDGIPDCSNGTDESNVMCENCTAGFLSCNDDNNTCISNMLICNGQLDCPNGKDESSFICQGPIGLGFNCGDENNCFLPFPYVCDGEPDCPNGNDEIDCNSRCPSVGPDFPIPLPQFFFCPGGTIYCNSGEPVSTSSCIPIESFCDGVIDCSNGRDESTAPGEFCGNCSTGFIQCPGDPNMTCVENSRGCDGVVDCPDGIDESAIACGYPGEDELPLCLLPDSNFPQCLSRSRLCDRVIDCLNGIDENVGSCGLALGITLLCPPGMSQCNEEMCLPFERFCDGVPDCAGGTDETIQTCGTCETGTVLCSLDPSNICVNNTAMCDGAVDCPNGIDESNFFCRGFRCDSDSSCYIAFDLVCDGIEHCPNGDDEQNCNTLMFPAGSVPGNEVFFSTVVFDDSIVGNDRLITTTLTVMPPGVFTSGGNVTNTTLMVIDNDDPPVILIQPADVELPVNSTAIFSVVASGSELSYQWFMAADITVPLSDSDEFLGSIPLL
ncbi:uncharacterized protein LOC135351076 [Halichondria panicea]|uniref:uncharacterized protein LOC135351076 n=1 Tax=Halichondria panicea TaxID=6063 RepID=UPI00312B97BC